jgi:hypothetical protein
MIFHFSSKAPEIAMVDSGIGKKDTSMNNVSDKINGLPKILLITFKKM